MDKASERIIARARHDGGFATQTSSRYSDVGGTTPEELGECRYVFEPDTRLQRVYVDSGPPHGNDVIPVRHHWLVSKSLVTKFNPKVEQKRRDVLSTGFNVSPSTSASPLHCVLTLHTVVVSVKYLS